MRRESYRRWIEMGDYSDGPRRGDIIQTNVGDRRERTMLVIASRPIKRKDPTAPPRFWYHAVRWWQIEPWFRMALYRSACRRPGGQRVIPSYPFPAKKKQTLEQHIGKKPMEQMTFSLEPTEKAERDNWLAVEFKLSVLLRGSQCPVCDGVKTPLLPFCDQCRCYVPIQDYKALLWYSRSNMNEWRRVRQAKLYDRLIDMAKDYRRNGWDKLWSPTRKKDREDLGNVDDQPTVFGIEVTREHVAHLSAE